MRQIRKIITNGFGISKIREIDFLLDQFRCNLLKNRFVSIFYPRNLINTDILSKDLHFGAL